MGFHWDTDGIPLPYREGEGEVEDKNLPDKERDPGLRGGEKSRIFAGVIFWCCVIGSGSMTEPKKPWELTPKIIKKKVTDFRIAREITKTAFAEACSMSVITLRKIERGIEVDPKSISRVANTFPKVFA